MIRVSAIAPDGVVEAIESDVYPAAGLQFHPEESVKAVPSSRLLDVFRELDVLCGSGADICVLSNAQCRVEVELTGARIVSWRDGKGQERLFVPEKKLSDGGEWSHGGVPLCWPWFGRKDGMIHGFIRNKRFSVVRRTADELLLRYSLESKEEPSFPYKAFPRPSNGSYRMTDEGLRQMLSLHSSGNSHIILWSPGTVEPCNRNLRPEDMPKFVGCGPAFIKSGGTLVLQSGEAHTISLQMSL